MSVDYIIPSIGSRGYFQIKEPFATPVGALYTCKSLRKLSDYISASEEPYPLIYQDKGASEQDYEEDLAKDMVIVGLQSDSGHWHYFPTSYLIAYPDPNGVPYRKMGVFIALPPMPVDKDLNFLKPILTEHVKDLLGVPCAVSLTETSQIQVVSQDKHDTETVARAAIASKSLPEPARVRILETQLDAMRRKIMMLEAYIIRKGKPESQYGPGAKKDLGTMLIELATNQQTKVTVSAPDVITSVTSIRP